MSEERYTGTNTDFYVTTEEVADCVNLAIELGRPILVEGEPGCGKTMLAYSIAAEKKLDQPIKISVKSTSRAHELLYRVNSLRRLQDAQNPVNTQAQFIYPYLSLGPLGKAIHQRRRCVVLIDEIDKADIDFPNDLLDVLDKFSFEIEDLPPEEEEDCKSNKGFGRTISTTEEARPIVVITSNREKRLPEPFLRRCLYICLKLPTATEVLCDIVRKNTRLTVEEMDAEVMRAAVDAFQKVRSAAVSNTQKPPTTSELIDWVKIIHWKGISVESLLEKAYLPPYWQLMFKSMNDIDAYSNQAKTK